MKIKLCLFIFLAWSFSTIAQNGWTLTNSPVFNSRVDDLFMVNAQVGYAVSGDGKIVKTTNGGDNWSLLSQTSGVYYRSVEFINTQKGFVGGFPNGTPIPVKVLQRTVDGGATWTDLTNQLPLKAKKGICGLAVADENTIYGGGNWYQDSGYIVKSTDGGNSWSLIDMSAYASSIIDMYFINKDTGFVTGKSQKGTETAIILYTTDGGLTWAEKFYNGVHSEYCWKIQRLTERTWFASIQDLTAVPPTVLRSDDGGMSWRRFQVSPNDYNIEGIGFIDPLHGWTGGDVNKSFETRDGGKTWDSIPVVPLMNRVFKVNDTMILATGTRIWKYKGTGLFPSIPSERYAWINCRPNPVKDVLTIDISIAMSTHVMVRLLDGSGKLVKTIDNTDKLKGSYHYYVPTTQLQAGMYYVVLKTHEDQRVEKIIVGR